MNPVIVRAGLAGLALVLAQSFAFGQTLVPRAPAEKKSLEALSALPASDRVTVKFREGLKVRLRSGVLTGLDGRDGKALDSALASAGVDAPRFRRLHSRPEEALDRERAEAEAESGEQAADRNLYFQVDVPAGASAAIVADALNKLSFVEYASPAPRPAPSPVDISPKTPNFKGDQGYLKGRGQGGVGALSPDKYPGADGKGMRFADVEYSWRLDHEDLEIPNNRILPSPGEVVDPFNNRNHGTAVLGEAVGKSNKYGVTGLAPAAFTYVSGANRVTGYSPADAISVAASKLRSGDVMLLEQQYWTCGFTGGDKYGPLETLQDVFDEIKIATGRGIVVVEAAGNGELDLDAPACNGQFNRNVRDSGAIIVGAGSSGGRVKLWFSSFGSRVDVQGWGENVTTTGYGNLFNPGDERQWYTAQFNGTSSASPIVAGSVLQIQGVLKACGEKPLKAKAMRKLLVDTGAKQLGGGGKIGPLPQILDALKATKARQCVLDAGRLSTAAN
ncbi:S8 family peptidase [Hansschlegelia zhihuaiae]|uniref:Peptidase S8 n=1 Tax=Hansschlegelia zhihuaiae TaxID=405005 RepID=A0A4Q0MLV1_9HYPH|nr:S8 family peptidase [Hansschlegelia zhihuaiae]RXF74415.1 peptidase S8 [Hansschlegelia zhihuaiae]